MKRTAPRGSIQRRLAAAAVAACFAAEIVWANPVGPVVVNGQVTFAQAGRLLSITNSPGSIINWQQFSIGARETTRFIQQSPASAVLNRVVGGDPSAILGTLRSNGRVFLINPNGILFGSGARIDVGGLVASTLRLSDEDFLAGRMKFLADPAQPAAAIVNQGRITASAGGQVFLVGSAVDNQGVITAPNGDIVLAAGGSVRVTESAGSPLQVEITAPADRSVNLSETLYGSRGLYGGLVRNSGTINANSAVQGADGRIVLKASHDVTLEKTSRITANGAQAGSISVQAEMGTLMAEGVVEATGSQAQGGRIELLGERVALLGSMEIDASGSTGGGTVLVGGDYQGGNHDVQNAERSYVAREVEIRADAGERGNGGKVVVWADDTTEFRGAISARGGAGGGDGGSVEVSGKETLVFRGSVDTRAPRGRTGALLLDPANIIVSTGTNDSPDDGDALPNSFSGAPSGVTGAVAAGDNPAAGTLTLFESELEGIAATTSISLAASNNITINNLTDNVLNLAQTAGNSVTFTAGGAFLMTAGDTIQTAGGAVNIAAGGIATIAGLATAGGAITIEVGAASTVGGVIGGTGTSLTKQGAGTLTFNAANTYTGSTTVSAGTLVLGANNQIANGSTVVVNGGTLDINSRTDTVGGVQLVSGSITGTTGVLTSSSAYDVRSGSVSAILGGAVALNKSTTGTVTLSRANTYTGTTTINAGTLRYGANNALAAGAVTVNDGGTYDLNGFSDTIGALTVNSGVTGGAVGTGAGTLTLGGNVTSTGGAANASISGNLGLGAAVRTFTTTNAADGLDISAVISGTGSLTKAGAGTLTLSGANTYTGVTRINAGVLRAGVLANGGVVSAIGASTNAAANLVLAGGTLQYTGPTVSIDRSFTLSTATTSTIDVTDAAATLTIAGASTATTGALTKAGPGTLTLSGANLHTGITTINAGTLRYGVSDALATGAVTVNDGGTYDLAGFSDSIGTLAVNSGATGGTVTTGTGTLTLTGNISSTGGAVNASISGNLAFAATRTITTTNAADGLEISAAISGAGGLTKAGAGTVTLSGTNIYTGTTTINAGALRLSGGNAIVDTGAVALANVASAVLELNGAGETIGNLSGGGATGGNIVLDANTLTINQAGATTYSGAIGGTGGIVKSGAGNLTLSGASTYDGATTINAGTLTTTSAAALGSGAGGTTVGAGTTLALNGTLTWAEPFMLAGGTLSRIGGNPTVTGAVDVSTDSIVTGAAGTLTLAGDVSGAGALTKTGAGIVLLSGDSTHTGATNINAGTLRVSGGNGIGDASAVNLGGGTLDLAGATETVGSLAGTSNVTLGAGTLTAGGDDTSTAYSGVISGAGGLTKQGTGTLTLTGNNSYTGATNVNDGTLALGAANRIGNASAVSVASGATFDLAGFAETVGSIDGAGNITLGAATLTAGNGTDTTFSGVISGTGAVTKLGTGTLELSGANTYSGSTLVSAGTLMASNASALGTTSAGTAVTTGATLAINNVAIGAEAVTLNGAGVGGAGALRGVGTALLAGDVALGSASTVGTADTLTLSGVISGAQALTKTGAGTLVLSGLNTYTGTTTINAGTLRYGVNDALAAGAVVVNAGGTYDLAGFSDTIGALAVNSGVTGGTVTTGTGTLTLGGNVTSTGGAANASISGNLGLGAATRTFTTTNAADGLDVSAVVSGGVGLTKAGAGTLTLPGANTYTGTTTINAGTLSAANASALGATGTGTTVASGGTLNINNVAIGSEVISLAGNGVGGAGALTGTGAASLAGTLTLATASRIGTTSGASTLALDGAVNAGGNALNITGAGDLAATNVLNNFGAVTVNGTGDVALIDANALTIGASSVGKLSAQTLSGNLTLAGNVTATGSGDTIVLAAAANFDNTGGFSLTPGGGRWLVYSTSPAGSTEGGLTAASGSALPRLYGRSFGGNPPGSITEPGNHLVYSTQPVLTVTPDNKTKVYGTNDPAQTFVATGFINDDGVLDTAVTAGLTGSFGRVAGETVTAPGPGYAITQGTFTSNASYSIGFDGSRTLAITPAPLTGTIASQSKVYGANDPALGGIAVNLAGLVNANVTDWNGNVTALNDTGNVGATLASLTRTAGETVAGGPYAITGSTLNALTGSAAGNYSASLSTAGNTLAITPALLTATITDQSKIYGANDPALAGIAVNLAGVMSGNATDWNGNVTVLNDTANVSATLASLARTAGETTAGGPYAITGGTLNALTGGAAGNYSASLSTAGNTLAITPAPLTVTANAQSKTYGAADPVLTFGAAGLITAAVNDWNGNSTLINDTTASVLSGTLDRAAGESVAGGPYAITSGTLAANGNYSIGTFTSANLTIVPAPLTIIANDASRAASQPNPPFSATYSGFQFGDTPADLTGTLSFSTPAALDSPAGAYAITPFGQTGGNYVFTYVNGTLIVSAAPLSSATFVNPLIPAVNSFVPDPQAAPSGAPAVVAMDSSLTPLPATAAGSAEGAEQSAAEPARPVEDTWRCFRSGSIVSIVSRQCR